MSRYDPADMVQARLVEIFRGDALLASPSGSLLFPSWAASLNASDKRVYGSNAELPQDADVREQLPRLMIECLSTANGFEQDNPAVLNGAVVVYLHTLVPAEEEELGARINARATTLVLSTPLSDVRIIAAELVPDGSRTKQRIPAFNDAWEFVSRYRSANVGVLLT